MNRTELMTDELTLAQWVYMIQNYSSTAADPSSYYSYWYTAENIIGAPNAEGGVYTGIIYVNYDTITGF